MSLLYTTELLPPSLLKDLPHGAEDILGVIFQRLNALPLSGDCRVLAKTFQLAADTCGVLGVTVEKDAVPMLVPRQRIHGRELDHNVDGAGYWFFRNHFWCEYQNHKYDLLFMTETPPVVTHVTQMELKYHGISYDIFSGGQAIIDTRMFPRLNGRYSQGCQGFVGETEEEIWAYIDQHRTGLHIS